MAFCLVVLMLAPLVPVLGYETVGHRYINAAPNRAVATLDRPSVHLDRPVADINITRPGNEVGVRTD